MDHDTKINFSKKQDKPELLDFAKGLKSPCLAVGIVVGSIAVSIVSSKVGSMVAVYHLRFTIF